VLAEKLEVIEKGDGSRKKIKEDLKSKRKRSSDKKSRRKYRKLAEGKDGIEEEDGDEATEGDVEEGDDRTEPQHDQAPKKTERSSQSNVEDKVTK